MNEVKCPIPDSHDRFEQSHYHLSQMITHYHEPDLFRCYLNAFLPLFHSVTELLEKEIQKKVKGINWWDDHKKCITEDDLLNKFRLERNKIIHKRDIMLKSTATIGIFSDKKMKRAIEMDIPVHLSSVKLLEEHKDKIFKLFGGEDHSEPGEEAGIKRKWVVEKLGNEEVVSLCDSARSKMGTFMSESHEFCKFICEPPSEHEHEISMERVSVIVESDIDPNLPTKWGW